MAKDIGVGAGAIVEFNPTADGTTWVQVGCATELTLPDAGELADIDATCLESVAAVMRPGIPGPSEGTVIQIFDPGDTGDVAVQTAYDAKTVCDWRFVFPADGGKTFTGTFEAYVKNLAHPTVSGTDALQREIMLMKTGALTWTVENPV